jgi:hypothetical protein
MKDQAPENREVGAGARLGRPLERRAGKRGDGYYLGGQRLAEGEPLVVRVGGLRLVGAFHWSGVEADAPRLRGVSGRGVPIPFDVPIAPAARCSRPARPRRTT